MVQPSSKRADHDVGPSSGGTPSALREAEEELVETVERWAERALPRLSPRSRSPFRYTPCPPPEVRSARRWRPGREGLRGGAANALITARYHALDGAFAAYLGEPSVAAWVTFAKYSSRQVGEWIGALEAWMTMVAAVSDGSVSRGLSAARDLWLALEPAEVRDGALDLLRAALRGAFPVMASPGALVAVRDALVEANTEIFSRIGLTFHTFLDAESRGEDGRDAIAALVREARVEDPMGHLARAFARYRSAARLGQLASASSRGDRAVLHALRRLLVGDANWLIALQEQASIQRPTIFDHPLVRAVLGSVQPGKMRLPLSPRAPHDAFTLLPAGGNWADYATRMGLDEIALGPDAADATVVHFERGARAFVPAIGRTGTILDLFSRYLEGPAGELLQRDAPRASRAR